MLAVGVQQLTGDREHLLRLAILCGYLVVATGLVVVSFLKSFLLVVVASMIIGRGSRLLWAFSTQLLLRSAPGEILGGVFASEYALFTFASTTGAALIGFALGHSISVSDVLRWVAVLSLLPTSVWGLWTWIWSMREGKNPLSG
jgi:uncharacterized membrane protein